MKMKSACSLLFILLSNKLRLSNSLITAVTPCNDFSAACTLRRNFLQHYHAYDKLTTKYEDVKVVKKLNITPKNIFLKPPNTMCMFIYDRNRPRKSKL